MKLAEALVLRSDTIKKIDQLRARLQRSAVVTEGDTPAESIDQLLVDLNTAVGDLETVIGRINHTNIATEVESNITITDLLARRDALNKKLPVLEFLIAHNSNALNQHRAMRSELRAISSVNVVAIQSEIDSVSAELRRLDNLIQEQNWLTELI